MCRENSALPPDIRRVRCRSVLEVCASCAILELGRAQALRGRNTEGLEPSPGASPGDP